MAAAVNAASWASSALIRCVSAVPSRNARSRAYLARRRSRSSASLVFGFRSQPAHKCLVLGCLGQGALLLPLTAGVAAPAKSLEGAPSVEVIVNPTA